MGKSYRGAEKQNNKYSKRILGRKLKEEQIRSSFSNSDPPKQKPKIKWKPHSEIDDD